MKLATFFRSSASTRVRIALNLKNLSYDPLFIHLTKDGGQQHGAEYRALNPSELVPTLLADDGTVLTQSLAILEWLEETRPDPPLLPGTPAQRAAIRAFCLAIACDVHPLNNLRVLQHLRRDLNQDQAGVDAWYRHWIAVGLPVLEALLDRNGGDGPFCFGTTPTMADVCLVPQLWNARRYACPLDAFPRLLQADAAAMALPAFRDAAPEAQADAAGASA